MTNEEINQRIQQLLNELAAYGYTEIRHEDSEWLQKVLEERRAHEPKAPQCGATVGETSGFSAAECALPAGHPGVHQWQPLNRTAEPLICWCHKCNPDQGFNARMILCPDCGNKRCPKASDHSLACTNSNEPGQPGSVYA